MGQGSRAGWVQGILTLLPKPSLPQCLVSRHCPKLPPGWGSTGHAPPWPVLSLLGWIVWSCQRLLCSPALGTSSAEMWCHWFSVKVPFCRLQTQISCYCVDTTREQINQHISSSLFNPETFQDLLFTQEVSCSVVSFSTVLLSSDPS